MVRIHGGSQRNGCRPKSFKPCRGQRLKVGEKGPYEGLKLTPQGQLPTGGSYQRKGQDRGNCVNKLPERNRKADERESRLENVR